MVVMGVRDAGRCEWGRVTLTTCVGERAVATVLTSTMKEMRDTMRLNAMRTYDSRCEGLSDGHASVRKGGWWFAKIITAHARCEANRAEIPALMTR
jgi:hypothetical protein